MFKQCVLLLCGFTLHQASFPLFDIKNNNKAKYSFSKKLLFGGATLYSFRKLINLATWAYNKKKQYPDAPLKTIVYSGTKIGFEEFMQNNKLAWKYLHNLITKKNYGSNHNSLKSAKKIVKTGFNLTNGMPQAVFGNLANAYGLGKESIGYNTLCADRILEINKGKAFSKIYYYNTDDKKNFFDLLKFEKTRPLSEIKAMETILPFYHLWQAV